MDLLNIAPNQVSFKAQTQTKPATSPIQAAKEKFDNMDNGEKIVAGLIGLGVLTLATLAIAKGHHKKVKAPVSEPKIQPKKVEVPTSKPKIKTDKVEIGHAPRPEKQQADITQGFERAQQAVKEYSQGGNYGEIRKEATRNLGHGGKKVTREALSEAHSRQVAQNIAEEKANSARIFDMQHHAAEIRKNKYQNRASSLTVYTREDSTGKLKKAFKDNSINSTATAHFQDAQYQAQEISNFAQKNPTRKNLKRARIAQNQANEVQRNWMQVIKKEQIDVRYKKKVKEFQKQRNIAQMEASPNYKAGLEKQAKNAQKAAERKVARELKNITSKPEYKRTLQDFQRKRYTGDKLIKIMENPNSSDFEYFAAQELLEKMTR